MFVLKRRRYDGTSTVVCRYSQQSDAQEDADTMNRAYQSDQYYVEPLDESRLAALAADNVAHAADIRATGRWTYSRNSEDYAAQCSKSPK